MTEPTLMINGLPGKMAREIFKAAVAAGFKVVPFSLTGPQIPYDEVKVEDRNVNLIAPNEREEALERILGIYDPFIVVDFTHPTAVNLNGDSYCRHKRPFVIGTTGGDRKALVERVKDSEISAVIAPNMAMQIVALQQVLKELGENQPNLFRGEYKLEIAESHQNRKADVSGTAVAMVELPDGNGGVKPGYLAQLGLPFDKSQINFERRPQIQLQMGIPKEFLDWHGHHTYTVSGGRNPGPLNIFYWVLEEFLMRHPVFAAYDRNVGSIRDKTHVTAQSPDKAVTFRLDKTPESLSLTHNVNGGSIYMPGILQSARYLHRKSQEGSKGEVFTALDVMKDI